MSARKTLETRLRQAYRDGGDCPAPEVFLPSEWSDLPAEKRRELERHLGACPACSAEWDLANGYDDVPAEMTPDEEARLEDLLGRLRGEARPAGEKHRDRAAGQLVRFPTVRRLLRRPAFGLAAAAMVVAAVGIVLRTAPPAPPLLPGVPTEDTRRSGTVVLLEPGAEVDSVPIRLVWQDIEGAHEYRVILTGVDETVIWQATVPRPPALLPEETRRELHRAVVYFWRVEAFDSSGRRIGWSEPAAFKVVGSTSVEASEAS